MMSSDDEKIVQIVLAGVLLIMFSFILYWSYSNGIIFTTPFSSKIN